MGPGRLKGRTAFEALRRSRHRVRMGELRVAYVPPGSSKGARVAYAVTRQTGGAVTRNRIRRRLRAAITQMGVALPPGDYLIGAGAGITQLPFEELKAQLWKAIEATTTAAERP